MGPAALPCRGATEELDSAQTSASGAVKVACGDTVFTNNPGQGFCQAASIRPQSNAYVSLRGSTVVPLVSGALGTGNSRSICVDFKESLQQAIACYVEAAARSGRGPLMCGAPVARAPSAFGTPAPDRAQKFQTLGTPLSLL